jgi:hypothetical protein
MSPSRSQTSASSRRLSKARSSAAALFLLALAAAASAGGPFEKAPRDYAVRGVITTSDRKSASGLVFTTLGKPLEIYDAKTEKHVPFKLADVVRIDVEIAEEHEEPYWYWKESGSDEKVFTGKTYPWRLYTTTVTFKFGRKITGPLSGLVYLEKEGGKKTPYVLHKRQKGKEGHTPKDLVYVVSIVLGGSAAVETPAGSAASEARVEAR